MSLLLLPQIPKYVAVDLAAAHSSRTIVEARHERASDHPLKIYSATGGSHATAQVLERVRDAIETIAREYGYPSMRPAYTGDFDTAAAGKLFALIQISANEASKPGVWQFLACVLMPDIVLWRQRRREGETVNPDNFLDSTNNLFRRLWWRARIFHDASRTSDPLWLLDVLLEDAIQTFYERRSLSGTPGLGVAFGRIYNAAVSVLPKGFNMEGIERTAQKWLVRIGQNVALEYLDPEQQIDLLAEAFHRSLPLSYVKSVTPQALVSAAGGVSSTPIEPVREGLGIPIAPPKPKAEVPATSAAFKFEAVHLRAFGAKEGTFSIVTDREASASELNLTGPEAKLAERFFGRERIHVGPVRLDPMRALQRFRLYPNGDLVYLNVVYPKPDRTEMRLYLASSKGFKPSPGSVWFMFQEKRDLFIGWMSHEDWAQKTGEKK